MDVFWEAYSYHIVVLSTIWDDIHEQHTEWLWETS